MIALAFAALLSPMDLSVGDGKRFSRIEDAIAVARPDSTIDVYPSKDGYTKTAIRITKKYILLCAHGPIKLEGTGFDYSGDGAVPRAIIQFEPGADGSRIIGFKLVGAHNASHNGAGVRVNGASKVRIENCDIHGNDMGIMSNGREGDAHACEGLVISGSKIHENGDIGEPGQNHNLYLGGTSVQIYGCDIFGALTGHNLKSRAHYLRVEKSYIYGGNNRQLDLVDAWDTERPNSNAVFIDTMIEMNPDATGNHNAIHFGQEKGSRNGTLYLIRCEIINSFGSPTIAVDSPKGSVAIWECKFATGKGAKHPLVSVTNGASLANVSGALNEIPAELETEGTQIDLSTETKRGKAFYLDGDGKPHEFDPR